MKYLYSILSIALLLAPGTATYGQLLATPTRIAVEAQEQKRTVQV